MNRQTLGWCESHAAHAIEYFLDTCNDQVSACSRARDIGQLLVDDGFGGCRDDDHRAFETFEPPYAIDDYPSFGLVLAASRTKLAQAVARRNSRDYGFSGHENRYVVGGHVLK